MPKTTNRDVRTDTWSSWHEEAERWAERKITDGAEIDRLYDSYLAGDTPLYALMMLKRPERGMLPVAVPTHRALKKIEKAYLKRQGVKLADLPTERQYRIEAIFYFVVIMAGIGFAAWMISR